METNELAPLRRVTLEKLKRDADRVREYARFVIELAEEGPRLIDNGSRFRKGLPFARLIAVLGPAEHKGVGISQAVLLEIGYSRTRPYAQLEYRHRDEAGNRSRNDRWFLKSRPRVRELSYKEFVLIHPILGQCMAEIVLECRESWHNKGPWWVAGPGGVERGIYFTLSKSDRLLYRYILAEDMHFRKRRYISWHAQCIRYWIGHYRHAGYSQKQLRGFGGAQKVAELIERYKDPVYRLVLVRSFSSGSKIYMLLCNIGEAFNLELDHSNEHTRLLFEEAPVNLAPLEHVSCRIVKQPERQARGCVVFEVTLKRRYREREEIPF